MTRCLVRIGLPALVVAALVTACSSVGASTTARVPDERAEIVPVAGCEGAWTDPADMSSARKVARCAPRTPAPRPLSQPATVVVALAFRLEFAAPVLLADALGEFALENLSVKFVSLPSYDAVPQLSQGQIDASVTGYDVALFNSAFMGLGVKAVMGNYFPPDAGNYAVPQTGLWCRRSAFSNPADPDPAEAQDLVWATSNGKAIVSFYYAVSELEKRVPDLDPSKIRVNTIAANDAPSALRNGAVDCATLIDPLWIDFVGDEYVQIATQTPAEPLGMVLFGRNLLESSPAVGDAFIRAVVRTINTYLDGDYHADPQVMAVLAKQMNVPVDRIVRTPSLLFDWELRSSTPDLVQRLFIDVGVLTSFDTPIAEEKLIDRSFTDRAVGRTG